MYFILYFINLNSFMTTDLIIIMIIIINYFNLTNYFVTYFDLINYINYFISYLINCHTDYRNIFIIMDNTVINIMDNSRTIMDIIMNNHHNLDTTMDYNWLMVNVTLILIILVHFHHLVYFFCTMLQ